MDIRQDTTLSQTGVVPVPKYEPEPQDPTPFTVTTGNLVIDDFTTPIEVGKNEQGAEVYILKNSDGTLPTDSMGRFRVTTDPNKRAAHGEMVNYWGTNLNQLDESNLGSSSTMHVELQAPNSYATAMSGLEAFIQASYNAGKRPIINVSFGPINQLDNGNFLCKLNSMGNANVSEATDTIITWAAGNSGINLTSLLENAMNTSSGQASPVIAVGAIDKDGHIASYSNYSTAPNTMIFVPVTGRTAPTNGVTALSFEVGGTSFAAPQIHYLIKQILLERPELTREQLHDILFNDAVAPRESLPAPNGAPIEVRVITAPLSQATVDKALDIANTLFPKCKLTQ